MTAQAVSDKDYRTPCSGYRRVQLVDPCIAMGFAPHAKINPHAIIEILFPQRLPMMRPAIVEAGNREKNGAYIP